jgi:Endonuclease/Exonuclease/phosphatase family
MADSSGRGLPNRSAHARAIIMNWPRPAHRVRRSTAQLPQKASFCTMRPVFRPDKACPGTLRQAQRSPLRRMKETVTDRPRPIRMATSNLWWRFGPWPQRRDTIAAVLANAQPDVCGLQEVWAHRGEHQAALLAERLGMQWVWTPSPAPQRWQQRLGDPTIQYGNAILSRWPIAEQASQRLPAAANADDGRTVLFARVQTPTGPVPLFTTQLTSTIGGRRSAAGRSRPCAGSSLPTPARGSRRWSPATSTPNPMPTRSACWEAIRPPRSCLAWSWWTPGGMPIPWRRAGPGTAATRTSRPRKSPALGSTMCWLGCLRPLVPAGCGRSG